MHDHEPPEDAAVRHLLTAPLVAARAARYLGADEVDWAGLLAETETMSGGETLLIRIAHDLWHAEKSVGLNDLTSRLDGRNFERVIAALRLCRSWPHAERRSSLAA
jgi:ABC-type iron transport system FetAB ATPase subunit